MFSNVTALYSVYGKNEECIVVGSSYDVRPKAFTGKPGNKKKHKSRKTTVADSGEGKVVALLNAGKEKQFCNADSSTESYYLLQS